MPLFNIRTVFVLIAVYIRSMKIVKDCIGYLLLLILFHSISSLPFTYFISLIKSNMALGIALVILINICTAVFSAIYLTGSVLVSNCESLIIIDYLFSLFPSYNFIISQAGLYSEEDFGTFFYRCQLMSSKFVDMAELDRVYRPLDWQVTGKYLVWMFLCSILYFTLLIITEYLLVNPNLRKICGCCKSKVPLCDYIKDDGVRKEEIRVMNMVSKSN